jgi:hypothetical protein
MDSGNAKTYWTRIFQRGGGRTSKRFLSSVARSIRWGLISRPTAKKRRLPDFIIFGVQKCGTTSLHEYISANPKVSPALRKEVRFFDRPKKWGEGVDWYRAHFPISRPDDADLTGEASPYYMLYPLAAKRVKQVAPEAKLITILRNPADRAFSHWRHNHQRGYETLSFEDAIEAEPERLDREIERLLEDETYRAFALQRYSYQLRGMYADQLDRWLALFPREQILVLSTEALREDRNSVVSRTEEFLGLPHIDTTDLGEHMVGRFSSTMDPTTRERLLDHFAPHNQRLFDLIGDDFGWDA